MYCFKLYLIVSLQLVKSYSAQDLLETVSAVVGHSAELPCNVTAETGDDKLNILAWYRNGSSTAFYSRDLRDGANNSATLADGRYRLVTSESEDFDMLQIVTVKPSDAGVYHCLADFASSPAHKTYVELVVIEPPRHLWVIYENGTQVANASAGVNVSHNIGPYYIGDTVHLFCVAFGGKPRAILSWWTEQRMLKDTFTPLSEMRVRSDVMYGPLRREDHGKVLTCYAKNNDVTAQLSIDVTIDMYLPPELVTMRAVGGQTGAGVGVGRVQAGQALVLQCRVLGARPAPPLVWRFNDSQLVNMEQNVTMEQSQRLLVSEIQLTMSRQLDEARVTCCAPALRRADDSYVCAPGLPLTVLYPPVLEIITEEDLNNNTLTVIKGSNISLACSHQANPAVYELIWYHENDTLSNADSNRVPIQSILELRNVDESHAGEYVCSATNDEGTAYSEPLLIDVTYPSYCKDESTVEYGVGENESKNLTCTVSANPEPNSYRWVLVDDAVNISTLRHHAHTTVDTEGDTLLFQRPNDTAYSTIFCWGMNGVPSRGASHTPCSFLVTDETAPRPPTSCTALKNNKGDIDVSCERGHDGRLPQQFKFAVKDVDEDEQLMSIVNQEPKFIIQEPRQEKYKFVITAFNDKGESRAVEIEQDDIIDQTSPVSAVSNITTLSLALCGGVALVALAACGLVLYAHARAPHAPAPRAAHDPPLCAYNTEESNCETYHDSDDGSECNVRRTDSFRRAMSRYPSKNFDVRRTSSFHSARYMNEPEQESTSKYNDVIRHGAHCRVHSLQNINKKREMDALCDHLVLHLPPETNYNVPRPMNTFYTMPRKMRQKLAKELSDETSEITQTSDGFSLPPPPDEFGTYRAANRIKDMPSKSIPTYTTIIRKNSTGREPGRQYNNVTSPMNTVGLPTISGAQGSLYTYPDDDHNAHHMHTNPFGEDSS